MLSYCACPKMSILPKLYFFNKIWSKMYFTISLNHNMKFSNLHVTGSKINVKTSFLVRFVEHVHICIFVHLSNDLCYDNKFTHFNTFVKMLITTLIVIVILLLFYHMFHGYQLSWGNGVIW